MTQEREIIYESRNGAAWVRHDKRQKAYVVMVSGLTHSTSDSGYPFTPDGLSIAKARADYLDRRKKGNKP